MQELNEKGNFIWSAIEQDLAEGKYTEVRTRFPPEPNGYLHIGHTKALITDFGTARHFGGGCNLRFDDTNPAKEETEYVDGIMDDIRWLGFKWSGEPRFASEYYDKCYDIAVDWIKRGLAYVDELSKEEMREYRGTLTTPGKNSPWRDRPVEENLELFEKMKNGEFEEGSRVLRMKIDMASPNLNMRDPAMYRILYKEHHRTGKKWCIYPMYDFAHPIGDALEGITHSLCSLEYEDHRPLYDWVVNHSTEMLPGHPRQIEFARLNLTRTIMSKRYLRKLVEGGYVSGWDDPRMPTLCAMRRRGYTGQSVLNFIDLVGLSKADSVVDFALLEHSVREDLGGKAPRSMAVLKPLKITITNWDEGKAEVLTLENHPDHPEMGERTLHFTKHIFIESDDFMEEPPKKFFRLKPDGEVRLKGAYIIKCESVIKDENGNVTELLCSADLTSKSGSEGAERKVKGTLHWLSDMDAAPMEARLYEPLLSEDNDEEIPEDEEGQPAVDKKDFISRLNPNSLTVVKGALCERSLLAAPVGSTYQFLRTGYFCKDSDSTADMPVFNRTVSLKDTWAKVNK